MKKIILQAEVYKTPEGDYICDFLDPDLMLSPRAGDTIEEAKAHFMKEWKERIAYDRDYFKKVHFARRVLRPEPWVDNDCKITYVYNLNRN